MTATTAITPFNFNNNDVRVIVQDGNPWFVAADVCAVLGVKNHRDSLMHLDDDEKGVVLNDTPGGKQQVSVVNESGLYALVLRSRKPEAKKFTKWVTAEVLPSIRKTGQYARPSNPAIDYDRISPAQAQDLKELVHSIVDAGIQGFAETWARLHKKFRVNSYLELPATRFEEARDYLLGKLPEQPAAIPDAERLSLAFSVATEAGAQVQRTVFEQLAKGMTPETIHARTMAAVTFDRDGNPTTPWARAMQPREFITTADTLPKMISNSDLLLSDVQVSQIISACANVLSKRAVSRIAA